jgi:hypothetical protein
MGTSSSRKSRSTGRTPTPTPAAEARRPEPAPKAQPAPAAGLYPGLGITDETSEFGSLASRDRTEAVRGVVVHRTESSTMESTRDAYRERQKQGDHVGAHYLIGQAGETSLTVPTDKVAAHVRGNKDADWKGANAWSIGIENVGMPSKIDRDQPLRPQVEKLELPPAMRTRLLSLDDKALKLQLADAGYEVHTDITGPQKRANWNLVGAIATDKKLDIGKDVQAHEDVDYKTLGEGEPIKEFLSAMQEWPKRIAALEKKVAELKAHGQDPEALKRAETTLAEAKKSWDAVQRDKTPAENNALDAEKMLGEPGDATARESDRAGFYRDFWKRTQAIDGAVDG